MADRVLYFLAKIFYSVCKLLKSTLTIPVTVN